MLWTSRSGRAASAAAPWKCKKIPAQASKPAQGFVVLVHGLFLYGFYLGFLARRLDREGYDVYVCDYQTRRCGILEHGASFALLLDSIAEERGCCEARSMNIVTHSLGGIIARVALSALEEDGEGGRFRTLRAAMIGRTVMLAPPNKGSDMARRVLRLLPWSGRFAKPLPELSSAPEAAIHSIPVPKSFEIGIIAGSCDIEVAVPYTELASASGRTILHSDHALMPFYPHVYRELLQFLKVGRFSVQPA